MKRLGFFIVLIISLIIVFKTTISATNYIVVLNTTNGITETQVREWFTKAGHEELTGLAKVTIVNNGLSMASVGGGCYPDFSACWAYPANIQLEDDLLLSVPTYLVAHEYGHVWSNYFKWIYWRGSWNAYLQARGLLNDPRLNSTMCWTPEELIAEDYRELFGRSSIPRCDGFLGAPSAWSIIGLRDWLALTFTQDHAPPGYFNTPTSTSIATSTPTTVLTATKTPTPGIKTPTPTKCPKGWSRRNIC